MPDYDNLAALRAALTTDDADRRSDAYAAVFGADVEPRDVLVDDPGSETVASLADAGVVPPDSSADAMDMNEWKQAVLDRLDAIEAALAGGS